MRPAARTTNVQSIAREYWPRNIHVAHVVIDGLIESQQAIERLGLPKNERFQDGKVCAHVGASDSRYSCQTSSPKRGSSSRSSTGAAGPSSSICGQHTSTSETSEGRPFRGHMHSSLLRCTADSAESCLCDRGRQTAHSDAFLRWPIRVDNSSLRAVHSCARAVKPTHSVSLGGFRQRRCLALHYLERARIFLRFLRSLRIRFFLHFALIVLQC